MTEELLDARSVRRRFAAGARRIRSFDLDTTVAKHAKNGGGFGHLLMFGQGGFLDHKDTVANITLFAQEVLPRLRELNLEPHKAVAAE